MFPVKATDFFLSFPQMYLHASSTSFLSLGGSRPSPYTMIIPARKRERKNILSVGDQHK